MNLNALIDRYFIKNPSIRRFVTRLIEGNKDRVVDLLGCHLSINSVREHGYLRASRMAKWSSLFRDEAPVFISLSCLIPHIDSFVDAGANVGVFSCVLGKFQKIFTSLQIFAFEPDPDTFKRLQENLKGTNRNAFNIALSNESGRLRFVRGAVSHVTTVRELANAYSLNEEFEVDCRRLDSFDVSGNRIFIKIDVEGQELKVLEGASRWFDEQRCVAVYLDGYENKEEILTFLRDRGFVFLDGRTLEPISTETFSLLALREDWWKGVTQDVS